MHRRLARTACMKISVLLRTELAGAIALGLAPLHPDATQSSPLSAETLFSDDRTCPTCARQCAGKQSEREEDEKWSVTELFAEVGDGMKG